MAEAERALGETRGAVLTIAKVDRHAGVLEHVGMGDVDAHIYRPRSKQRITFLPGVLRGASQKFVREETVIGRHDLIVIFTDGLKSKVDISSELALQREHPIVIAESLIERFSRAHDDALVVVVR